MNDNDIYDVLKTFESKPIHHDISKNSLDLTHNEYFEILSFLEQKEYILETNSSNVFELTEKGVLYIENLEESLKQEKRNIKKKKNEYILSKWKLITFWPVFTLGMFGGLYSMNDILSKIKIDKPEIEKQETILEKTKESKEKHTETLPRKNQDSLTPSNSKKLK